MDNVIIIIMFGVAGGAMGSFGMELLDWQYWIVLASMVVISFLSYRKGAE